MKTKYLVGLTVVGLSALFATPAKAGVDFHISLGIPLPLPRIVVMPRPPVVCEAPVVVLPRRMVEPAPVVVVRRPAFVHRRPIVVFEHRRFRGGHYEWRHEHARRRH